MCNISAPTHVDYTLVDPGTVAGLQLLQLRHRYKNHQNLAPFLVPYTFVDASLEQGSLVSTYNIEFTLPRLFVRDGIPIAFELQGFDLSKVNRLRSKIVVS